MTIDGKLDLILSGMTDMKKDIADLRADTDDLRADMSAVKADVAELKADVSEVKSTVSKNYDKTLEFYAVQQEHNTEVLDALALLSGKLEIYADQTARNTLALKRYR